MAETQHSIRLVKKFNYRGDPTKTFSNRYYFDGASPGDSTAWHTFMDAFVLAEKAIHTGAVTITDAFGYAPGSDVAVASRAYTTVGTLPLGVSQYVPGDCAVVMRMATTKKSTKNHTVYVFSYYHQAIMPTGAYPGDSVAPAQLTAVSNFGQTLVDGITVSGRVYKRCTPDGHLVTGRLVDPFIGHRDFPR
jgi:hypothetical protein